MQVRVDALVCPDAADAVSPQLSSKRERHLKRNTSCPPEKPRYAPAGGEAGRPEAPMSSAACSYLQTAFQVGVWVPSRTVWLTPGVQQQEEHAPPEVLLLLFDGCDSQEETSHGFAGPGRALLATGYWQARKSLSEPVVASRRAFYWLVASCQ